MFHDAEELAVAFYRDVFVDELRAGSRVPNPRPRLFLRAWRTGGTARNRILDQPIITTTIWGTDDEDTDEIALIAGRSRDAMYGSASILIAPCRGVEEVTGLYFDPDPASAAPRYTFSSRLLIRAKF